MFGSEFTVSVSLGPGFMKSLAQIGQLIYISYMKPYYNKGVLYILSQTLKCVLKRISDHCLLHLFRLWIGGQLAFSPTNFSLVLPHSRWKARGTRNKKSREEFWKLRHRFLMVRRMLISYAHLYLLTFFKFAFIY